MFVARSIRQSPGRPSLLAAAGHAWGCRVWSVSRYLCPDAICSDSVCTCKRLCDRLDCQAYIVHFQRRRGTCNSRCCVRTAGHPLPLLPSSPPSFGRLPIITIPIISPSLASIPSITAAAIVVIITSLSEYPQVRNRTKLETTPPRPHLRHHDAHLACILIQRQLDASTDPAYHNAAATAPHKTRPSEPSEPSLPTAC